jgi:uncharacterized SAM-binding protein YcdF (DUF218 family)
MNWGHFMYIYLSEILPLMVLPIGIVFELLLIALLLLWSRKRRSGIFFIVTAMAVLWICSMPIVANTVLGKVEQRYPAVSLNEIPDSKCLVVLGGAIELVQPPRVEINLSDSVDRISKTASLYRAGKAKVVIVSGGNQPWAPGLKSEAVETRTLLVAWGVPAEAIVVDETSRNTYENAFNSITLLRESECRNPLLVTSAAHMTRAVASFAKFGVEVFPVSVDVRAVRTMRLTVIDFIPSTHALGMTTNAMREWVGQRVYRYRGWN